MTNVMFESTHRGIAEGAIFNLSIEATVVILVRLMKVMYKYNAGAFLLEEDGSPLGYVTVSGPRSGLDFAAKGTFSFSTTVKVDTVASSTASVATFTTTLSNCKAGLANSADCSPLIYSRNSKS